MYQLKRFQWVGITMKVFKAKFEGVRSVGKPMKKWEDVVQ
jgi:hypothetical protein